MMFAPLFDDSSACRFAERTFEVTAASLQHLARCYPLPPSLQRAVLKRQVEFLAGRVCAQRAAEALTGRRPAAIPPQPDRAPAWPPGMVGSITHTSGYAAALVASATDYQGIGLDCEVLLSRQQLALRRHICVAGELEALQAAHPDWAPEQLLTLIFSAKESLFKCLYRKVQAFFGFPAARVLRLQPAQHTFVIQLEYDLTPELRQQAQWTGQFACQNNLLLTALLYISAPQALRASQSELPACREEAQGRDVEEPRD